MNWSNLLYRALRRLRLQSHFNWSARLPDVGATVPMLGDPLGYGLMLYGTTWKPEAFRRIARAVPFRTALDVGANEGQTIIDLAKAGLSEVRVLAFEPNPACAYYLSQLIRLNAWGHVQLFPIALADGARCRTLELASTNDSGASIVPTLRPGLRIAQRLVVPCFSLDQLVETNAVELEPPFLLKIDVEGAELDVLLGSQGILRTLRPVVVCEVLWAHCQERLEFMRLRNAELLSLLRRSDYVLFRFVLTSDQRTITGIEELSEFPGGIYSARNAHQCDYLFVPGEQAEVLRTGFLPAVS